MQYLGALRGGAMLESETETIARAEYDFEGYLQKPGRVSCSGELRMSPEALRDVFGRKDLHLLTDDGRRLNLRFSEKELRSESDSTYVDALGDLPAITEWRH